MTPITLTVTVDVPQVISAPAAPFGNYHFSKSKSKCVLVADMHICHVFNAVREIFKNGLELGDIADEPEIQEMLYRLAMETEPE